MKKNVFLEGLRDGIPIALGYFAVSFSLGIIAKKAGLDPFQGFIASWLNVASAGEYSLFKSIAESSTYAATAFAILIINARYLLMSASMSQKFSPDTKFIHRFLVGYGVTDEIFGITISRPGQLNPLYNYGAMAVSIPLWSIGTALGIITGNFLPGRIVSALSVALYGMFIAIIVPPAKKNRVILIGVLASFALSFALNYAASVIPFINRISSSTRTIILTVAISAVLALVKPVKDEDGPAADESMQSSDSALNENKKES